MPTLVIGLDIGSTAVKGVLFNGQVVRRDLESTGWQPAVAAKNIHDALLREYATTNGIVPVVATGYGRVSLPEATLTLSEITCHARGAIHLDPEIRAVLDIGGQDCKAISIDERGTVLDFQMNDRCAAGSGKFLQSVCGQLGCAADGIDRLASNAAPAPVTSTCAVFAESEIVGMLSTGTAREAVAAGALRAVAERAAGLLGRLHHRGPILFTGGLAHNHTLREMLSEMTGEECRRAEASHFCGAIGAALLGHERINVNHSD